MKQKYSTVISFVLM